MKPKNTSIYLDYAAATPADPAVVKAMAPFWNQQFHNPSSLYQAAKDVRLVLDSARRQIAQVLGAKPTEIIFTAGGTESINLAVMGVLTNYPDKKFVTTNIEHEAVLATFRELERRGHKTAIVPANPDGLVSPEAVAEAIDDETVFVSVMLANNEIGTIQPVAKIAQLVAEIRRRRAASGNPLPLYLHTDACQAAGALDLSVARLGVDLLTLNGSKIYGPKQTGILYVKAGTDLKPLVYGGGQESGLRSGTENVPGSVGLATALKLAAEQRTSESRRLQDLRDQLLRGLHAKLDLKVNGSLTHRLPNNLNFSLPGIDGEMAVLRLDHAGIQVSTGSACSTGRVEPSHVLKAIGLSDEAANGSLRLTLGRSTTASDIETVIRIVPGVIADLRATKG